MEGRAFLGLPVCAGCGGTLLYIILALGKQAEGSAQVLVQPGIFSETLISKAKHSLPVSNNVSRSAL